MKLEGSCHCGAVKFTVVSHTPYPYMRCYCSICRKTAEQVEMMLHFAAPWADVPSGNARTHFRGYPEEGIADWHAKRGLDVA